MMLGAVLDLHVRRDARLAVPSRPPRSRSLLCALYGLLVELVAVRPFARRGSNAWLMATVALGIVADNAVLFTFGKEPRGLPSAAGRATALDGRSASTCRPLQLADPGRRPRARRRCCTASRAQHALRQGDAGGGAEPRRRAADGHQRAARHRRSPTRCPPLFAGVAGMLIAPLFNVHSDMGTLFGLKAFAVAILGGITSAWGVMLAGPALRRGRGADHRVPRLGLHADPHLRAGDRRRSPSMPNGLFGRAELKKV